MGDELEIPWKCFKWLQCLGEVINCPVLELNNTDAYLKLAGMDVPDLPVVTTHVCSSGEKKKKSKEKTTLGKMAPNLPFNEFPLNFFPPVNPITHWGSKVSAKKHSQTHKPGLDKQACVVASPSDLQVMSLVAPPEDQKKPALCSEMTASIPELGTNASAFETHERRFSCPQNGMRLTYKPRHALENAGKQKGINQPGPLLARRAADSLPAHIPGTAATKTT